MSNKLSAVFSTFFYVGYIPLCPGSAASALGVMLVYFLCPHKDLYVLFFFLITFLGFISSDQMEKHLKEKDPSCIVIDEVAGVFLAFFMLPLTWGVIFTGFFLFRALDMFKIYPINKFESLPGGAGVMMDDLMAGLYTNIIMHIALGISGGKSF